MSMKKILNEWRRFVLKESKNKSGFETAIEYAWEDAGNKYNELLAYVKAAMHALRFLNGNSVKNVEEYLNRVEFGKTAIQRIQEINRNAHKFAEMFTAWEVYKPAKDKRFKQTSEKTFLGIGIAPIFAYYNMDSALYTGFFSKAKTEEEAYREMFQKFEMLDQMLEVGNYDFLNTFGVMSGKTSDARHSGGAHATGLIILPQQTTEQEKEKIMNSYMFYLEHSSDPAYVMAIKAEEEFQKALRSALELWVEYGVVNTNGDFIDKSEEQASKGPYLRMIDALNKSKATSEQIKNSPENYSPERRTGFLSAQDSLRSGSPSPEAPTQTEDDFAVGMASQDAKEIWSIIRKLRRAKDPRVEELMAHYNFVNSAGNT